MGSPSSTRRLSAQSPWRKGWVRTARSWRPDGRRGAWPACQQQVPRPRFRVRRPARPPADLWRCLIRRDRRRCRCGGEPLPLFHWWHAGIRADLSRRPVRLRADSRPKHDERDDHHNGEFGEMTGQQNESIGERIGITLWYAPSGVFGSSLYVKTLWRTFIMDEVSRAI